MIKTKNYIALTLIALVLALGVFTAAYASNNTSCELSISATTIEEGHSIELTWSSEGAILGIFNPGNITLDPLSGGSMTLTPTAPTTYSAVFEAENGATATCEVSVTVTSPSPPPPPEPLVCSIPPVEGRIIVDLEMEVLLASRSASDAQTGPFVIDLKEGTYTVTLESFDNHDEKGGQGQVNEQWHLELNDSNGVVATTGSIDDLPADQNTLMQVVNTELVVSSSISSVTAIHSFYPDSNINSIRPICASFDPIATPPPPPPPPPQCLIKEKEGRVFVDLGAGVLVSHTSESASRKGPFSVTLPAGEYAVTLSSYDDHTGKPGQDQPNEQWHLELLDQGDSLITITSTIDDLPDDQDTLVQMVNTNLIISTEISSVSAVHSFYPNHNPNSIAPICVAFDLVPPPPPPPGEPFCTLRAEAVFVDGLGTIDITWASDLTISGILTPGNITLSPLSGGSVTATTTTDTTYVATFETSSGDTLTCEASITVPPPPPPPPPPGCTSGCGGGFTPPEIVLIQKSEPPLESLAFITLSQVPYTGFPAGPIGTAFFWTILILLSGVIAYFMSVKGVGPAYVFARLADKRARRGREEDLDIKIVDKEYSIAEHVVPSSGLAPFVDENSPRDSYNAYEMNKQEEYNSLPDESVSIDHLQKHVSGLGVLISEDGARYLIHRAGNDEHVAYTLLDKAVTQARTLYPREDGWLHLNRERLESILSENISLHTDAAQAVPANLPTVSVPAHAEGKNLSNAESFSPTPPAISRNAQNVSLFIGWLCEANGDKIFEFLRTLNSEGHSSQEFLTGVLGMFDEIYRQRLEGGRNVDSSALLYTQSLSKETLEQLMDLLTVGVDHSYRNSHTGVKMALVRALDYIHNQRSK